MRIGVVALLACFVTPAAIAAHDDAQRAIASSPSAWDLVAIGWLVLIAALYLSGQRRHAHAGIPTRSVESWAFWAGWSAMIVAIVPPLDGWAVQRFSAHMLQHELLMLVGAPLVVIGRPLAVCLWGLPMRARRRVGRLLQHRGALGAWRWLAAPIVAWALHGLIVWLWHVPALYESAVRSEGVHFIQHGMFVGSAMFFWWGLVYGRYGRAGYGAAVFYVFTTVVHTGLLGAVFTLAPTAFYRVYVERTPDAVADQQLAGLVMWVPAGIVLTLTGIGLFAAWMGEAERRVSRVPSVRR
jgi:putative membrane protein